MRADTSQCNFAITPSRRRLASLFCTNPITPTSPSLFPDRHFRHLRTGAQRYGHAGGTVAMEVGESQDDDVDRQGWVVQDLGVEIWPMEVDAVGAEGVGGSDDDGGGEGHEGGGGGGREGVWLCMRMGAVCGWVDGCECGR